MKWAADDFRSRGIESPRLDAELLVGHALSMSRTELIVDSARPLGQDDLTRLRELVKRRRAREPVAYLRGEREFYGMPFRVDRRVLVPRPDTEILVEAALALTEPCSMSVRALDLCTGSGCVAVAFARARPTARVLATDLSDDALAVARENAQRLGAYNVAFAQGDLFAAVPASWGADDEGPTFDVITANPPYIPTADIAGLAPEIRVFEPRLALDGGGDGLDLVRRIVVEAPRFLAAGGALALEIGHGEAAATEALMVEAGFTSVRAHRDYGGVDRVVSGRRGA